MKKDVDVVPCIVGNVKVVSVDGSGVVHFGDCLEISPQSSSKPFAGAGSFNTGDVPKTYNAISHTTTNDADVKDLTQENIET